MKIYLNMLKLSPYQQQDFHIEEPGDNELLDTWGGRFLQPVVVEGKIEHSGKDIHAQGKVQTVVELYCSRCLKPVTYSIDSRFFAAVVDENCQKDLSETEEDVVFQGDGIADLTPLVQEVIISDIPISVLCQEECRGLCPNCGKDLNTGTCNCRDDNIDPRWEKLKQLT